MLTETMTQTPHLTNRERQIIDAVSRGLSNTEIAQELGLSIQTIKNQLSALYDKLGLANRVELATYALRHGLIDVRR